MLIEIKKLKSHIILGLIIIGIFLPSSMNGDTFRMLYPVFNTILAISILILSIRQFNFYRSLLVLFIILFLIVNTILTNFTQYQFGTLLIIIPLLFYFSIDLKEIDTKIYIKYLNLVSIILFILGFGVIFNIEMINNFLSASYVTSFTDLYKYMLSDNRPVGPFGSHSIAAFMYFTFFIIYYVLWLKSKYLLYLIISIIYVLFILELKSFSALFFIIFSIVTIINSKFLLKKINIQFFIINISILVIIFLLLNSFIDVTSILSGSDTNGLLSRYGPNGVLNNSIDYLEGNLFMGDGIGYVKELVYTDSGYIHNLLIYGISGTIIFYITFYMCFLEKKFTYIFIMLIAFLFFEIGYDIFFYTRTIYVLLLITYFIQVEQTWKN